ncbi:uncharacterized protein LOC131935568 [Physella acuta]|uniref:uncharacterized protein LOC131935568 n=1 Tax=Physella acuta TaxID=109671 RepID=UPI0027DC76C1|nr:uncharacterized protein LOC131935568 [Physella acuta]
MAAVCSIPRLLPLLALVVTTKGVQAREFQLQLARASPPLDLTPPPAGAPSLQTAQDDPTGQRYPERRLTFRHLHVPLRQPRFVTETTTIFPFITAQKALSYLTRFDSIPRPRNWPIRIVLTDAEIQGTETKIINVQTSTEPRPDASRGANWPGTPATWQEAGREKWRDPGWTDASKVDGFYDYDKQVKAQVNIRYSRDVAHTDETWRDVRIKRNKGNSRRESANGDADVTTTHDGIRRTQRGNDAKQKQIGQRKTKFKVKKEKKASKKRRKDKKKKAVSSRRFFTVGSHDQVLNTSDAGNRTEDHTTTLTALVTTARSNSYLYGHIGGADSPNTQTGGADSPNTKTGGADRPNTQTGGADSPNTQSGGADSPNTQTGGADSPNTKTGGADRPNTQTVGADSPNTQTGGADSPNTQTGGADSPNTQTGGADSPNTQTGGADSPNTQTGGADSPNTQTSTGGADSPNTQTGGADSPNTQTGGADNYTYTEAQAQRLEPVTKATRVQTNRFDILSNANVSRAPMNSFDILSNANVSRAPMNSFDILSNANVSRAPMNSFDILSNANVSRAPMNSFDILSNANVSRAPMKNEAFGNYLSERLCGLFNKKYVRTNIGGRCE